ncbi:hypothetical protein [Aquabacterium sp.]|uniref:hypothetical protein n=1 Tax=Aquabacterium sp. TaxID=1872578 RepID=UPI0025BA273F|nr:hypothetical protein [Aquabacterium sp.]
MTTRVTALARVWAWRRSPEAWLLASNLGSRLLGFVVSLLMSRLGGVQALGLYSGLLITSASPTTPMSAVLANNATILAARHHASLPMRRLLRAQWGVALASALMSVALCWGMLSVSGLGRSGLLAWHSVMTVAAGMVLGQVLTQTVVGLCHGAALSLQASWVVSAVTLVALLLAYPLIAVWGVAGGLWQAVGVALLPGVLLGLWLWRRAGESEDAQEQAASMAGEARQQWRQAIPNILATVLNNATNWISCIYLAERFHGHAGLGLVAIGLQWMALMQLPLSSWGGRVMRALAVAHGQSAGALGAELVRQFKRCGVVSMGAACLVWAGAGLVADLYKVDRQTLVALFAINAAASALSSVNFVGERVFFCLGSQRPWLLMSVLAYVAQMGLTWVLIPHSILAVALGNLLAIALMAVMVMAWFRRLGLFHREVAT